LDKRDEIIQGWRNLHNEELHKFHPSPNVIRTIKSGHVPRIREKRYGYRVSVGKLEGATPVEDINVGDKIILNWILDKYDGVE
jgi:hypothetical protein